MSVERPAPADRPDHTRCRSRLSFVVCASDDAALGANLLASPCLNRGPAHEVIAIRDAAGAAAGLSLGIARVWNDLIVCVHQDVHLPAGWDRLMVGPYRLAERRYGPIGVAGVYGVGPAARRIGRVEDRGRMLSDGPGLPAPVDTLDELLLIVPRGLGQPGSPTAARPARAGTILAR